MPPTTNVPAICDAGSGQMITANRAQERDLGSHDHHCQNGEQMPRRGHHLHARWRVTLAEGPQAKPA
jgi:hypothetical protein